MELDHKADMASTRRFAFGENWSRFLKVVNDSRIRQAESSLREMLQLETLEGKSFLDIGCGSGLFSLAARRLGAKAHSFDCDAQSVACAAELKRRYAPDDPQWKVERGSVLDVAYLRSLGQWDVVCSWGVLHHTGSMRQALKNVIPLVREGGQLYIAIYNDQGRASKRWLRVKQAYNRLPSGLRWLALWPAFARLWGPTTVRDFLRGRPFHTWRRYADGNMRGMSPWRDVVDWVGGLPFEVAKPEDVFDFYRRRGFALQKMKTCAGGIGCNEFVFWLGPSRGGGCATEE